MDYYHVTEKELEIGTILSTDFIPEVNKKIVYATAKKCEEDLSLVLLAARQNKQKYERKEIDELYYKTTMKCQSEGVIEWFRQKYYPNEMGRFDSVYLTDSIENAQSFGNANRKEFHIYKIELLNNDPSLIKKYKMNQYEITETILEQLWSYVSVKEANDFLRNVKKFIDDYFNGVGAGDFFEYLTVDKNARVVEKIQ